MQDLRHSSLRAKKYDEARVDGGWRFYIQIEGDSDILLVIMRHPK